MKKPINREIVNSHPMKIPTVGRFSPLSLALAGGLLLPGALKLQAEGSFHLSATDASGGSSFNATLHFTNDLTAVAATPAAGNIYTVGAAAGAGLALRTPVATANYTFAGDALILTNGGQMSIKSGSPTIITIINFTNSGVVNTAQGVNCIATLAGKMTVLGVGGLYTSSTPTSDLRTITNATTMIGSGALTNYGGGYVVYTGNNSAFTGPVGVGPSFLTAAAITTLEVTTPSNLGGSPAAFNPAQLLLDYGAFLPRATYSLNNANCGITLNPGGGTFNVGSGIVLTEAEPITGPGGLTIAGLGTVFLTASDTYTNGTVVNGGILNVQNSFGVGTNGTVNQASGGRNSSIQLQGGVNLPATVNFTLSNDGTGTNLLTTNAVENISGNNSFNGTITLTVGGGNAAIQSDSGALLLNGNVRIASGQSSRGVILQGASTAANTITGTIADLSPTSVDSVTKNGVGSWTLSGTNTYTGLTIINGGTLFLAGSGSIATTPLISIASGATFDVSGLTSSFTLGAGQSISNSTGTVNGSIATSAGASIYPAAVGVAGTITCNNDLNMSAGGTAAFDLSANAASGNDQVVVGGNLTLSSVDYVHINALSGTLDTSDYVLFSVGTGTTMTSTPVLVWDGSLPGNYLNYALLQVGKNVVLHFSTSTAPSVAGSANPASATRNQDVVVTANVTQGSASIAGVTVDLTQIGGSSTAGLILDSADSTPPAYIYTNTFLVAASTAVGNTALTITATDSSSPTPLTGTYIISPLAITANAVDWDGGAVDNKWTSETNWTSDIGPGFNGDSVTFSGTAQLTPDLNTNYAVTSLTFDSTAGAFTIGSSTGSTLTDSGGIVNNSSSAQVLNVPVAINAAQSFNAASANLTFTTNVSLGGNGLTLAGTANTIFNGVISGTAGVTNTGSGSVVLSKANTFSGGVSFLAGVLVIGNDSALGSGLFNMADGVTIQSADSSTHVITNKLNFGSGGGGNNIFSGTGNLKFTGAAANGSAKTLTVNNPQTEFSGVLSGAIARTVAGTGVLVFSAADTYSGGTTISSGSTLQLGNGGTNGSLSTSGTIDDEGTLIIDRTNAVVQGVDFTASPIIGGGSFVQAGPGTTTLTAANTYAGTTFVNNGEVFITQIYQNYGNFIVADGARLGVSATSVTNSAEISSLTLGNGGATTLDLSYSLVGDPTNAIIAAGAVMVNGTCTIRVGGNFVPGTFPVLSYGSLSGAFAPAVIGPRGVTATSSNDTVHQIIYVTVTSIGKGIVWTGTNSVSPNVWDLNTTTNWLISGQPTVYIETVPPGDAVTFTDQGSGSVLLSNTASPASVTFSNTAVNYTFAGSGQINSLGGLNKAGAGSVTMNIPGTFSSSSVLSNGGFNFSANQTFANLSGNSALTVVGGAPTVTVNDTLNTSYSGNINGAMTLTLIGGGQFTLSGNSSVGNNLYVSAGVLALSSGSISASSYASIGHIGSDIGTVNLSGTANFTEVSDFNLGDIGASVGTLNIQDSANLTANAIYVGSANATSSSASGTVNQTGGTITEQNTTEGTFCVGGRTTGTSYGGVGIYNMSAGTLTAASAIRVGSVGTGTFNQTGGTVIANGGVNIARIAGSSGTYTLDGGTLMTTSMGTLTAGYATLNLNGGLLLALANNTAFVTNITQINVENGGAILDTTNFVVGIGSVLQHSAIGGDNAIDGGLTKRGTGTLVLSATGSTYTGPTLVTAGTLSLAPGAVNNLNDLTVNSAGLALSLNGGMASVPATSLAFTGNSALGLNYGLVVGTPVAALSSSGGLNVTGITTINLSGYGFSTGQFPLVTYTGTPLANLSNFALGALPYGVTGSLSNDIANSSIDLVVTAVSSITTWIPLTATDGLGTSGFATAGTWQSGTAPTPGDGYVTGGFALRSPADNNAYTFAGSALSVDNGGRFLMKGTGGQSLTVNNLIINGGLVDYANAADSFTETLAGTIILQGGMTSYIGALGSSGLSETLYENASISGTGNLQFGGATVNAGTDLGVVILGGTNTYTGTTTVASGTVLVNGVNGSSVVTVNANATLGGSGSIAAPVTVQAGGTLAPGTATRGALTAAIGTLTVGGSASVSGTVVMKINPAAIPANDELAASSVVINPGAVLVVNDIGSTNLVAGATFALFSTAVSGSFSSVTLPPLPGTNVYWTNNLAVNGTISVVGLFTVNTNSTNITTSVSGNLLTLSWPADHLGWHLQVQTNALSSGLGNNWVTIPGSDAIVSTNLTINPASGSVFYRLVYP